MSQSLLPQSREFLNAVALVQRRGFAELPPAIDAEIGAVIHHRLDLRNATGQINHVVFVGKTGSGDVELFHCIDSIRLKSLADHRQMDNIP